jgi:hypothetical protein
VCIRVGNKEKLGAGHASLVARNPREKPTHAYPAYPYRAASHKWGGYGRDVQNTISGYGLVCADKLAG